MADKTAKRNWSDKETLELISLWSDDVVQEELEGPSLSTRGFVLSFMRRVLKETLINVEKK